MRRVLILGTHEVVRAGLKYFIDCHLGASVFGEASTAPDALKLARQQGWDAAILDSTLGQLGGLQVLKELRQIQPGLPILVLSIHSEFEYAMRAFQAGAAGFIVKDSPREEMVKAVDQVINGGRYVSPAIAERLAKDLNRSTGRPLQQAFSYREFEVMCLIASGRSLMEIAGLLGLSDKTVCTYRARVLEKTGMRTNAEIIRYVIHNRLGELQSKQFMRPTRPLRNARSAPAPYSREMVVPTPQASPSDSDMPDAQAARGAVKVVISPGL